MRVAPDVPRDQKSHRNKCRVDFQLGRVYPGGECSLSRTVCAEGQKQRPCAIDGAESLRLLSLDDATSTTSTICPKAGGRGECG